MLHLKHNIQIHVKNEKEVFRLIRLLFFTFVLFNIAYEVPNYIWNIPLYWVSVNLAPWVVAIPAMIAVVCRKKSSGLFENNIIKQFVLGVLIGAGIAIIVCAVFILTGEFDIKEVGETSWKNILYSFAHYFLIVGPAEEMTFRVGIMECIQDAFPKAKWQVPIISNAIFALSHLKYHGWIAVGITFVIGAIYTMFYWRWSKRKYVMVSSMHASYDFWLMWIEYIACRIFA